MTEATTTTVTKPTTLTGKGGSRHHLESLGYFRAENCNSCGVAMNEQGCTSFFCPACGQGLMGRCRLCRDQSASYACPECGFSGP